MTYLVKRKRGEEGMALFLVLALLTTVSLLGLAMLSNGITEGQISDNYGAEVTARMLAEAGLHQALIELRGQDFTQALRGPNGHPDSSDDTARTFDFRNPISLQDPYVRPTQLDLDDPQAVISATGTDDGILPRIGRQGVGYYLQTGPDGRFGTADDETFFAIEQTPQPGDRLIGRYLVKITNNPDDPGGPFSDTDGTLLIRSLGLVKMTADGRIWGVRNAWVLIETKVRIDMTFKTEAPVTILGPDLAPEAAAFFDAGATQIQGNEYLGLAVLNTTGRFMDPLAEPMTQQLLRADGRSAVLGAGLIPSIRNIAGRVAADQLWDGRFNPDGQRALNPVWLWHWIYKTLPRLADQTFRGGDPGNLAWQGTLADPKLVVVDGNLTIAGNPSGAGLLVVTGRLRLTDNALFKGTILVIGEQAALDIQGQPQIEGGLWISRLRIVGRDAVFDTVRSSLRGSISNRRDPNYQTLAMTLLPFVPVQWREIHPEMDP